MKNKTIVAIASIIVLATATIQTAEASLYLQYLFNDQGNGINIEQEVGGQPNSVFANYLTGDTPATYVPSPGGTAVHFDGLTPHYFALPTSEGNQRFPLAMYTNMSVGYWVNFDTVIPAYQSLAGDGNDSGATAMFANQMQYHTGTGLQTTQRFVNSNVGNSPNSQVSADAWHHLVWTVNGTIQKFYSDGVLMHTQNAGVNLGYGPGSVVRFGLKSNMADLFGGDLDQLEVYNNVLSGSDVLALFNAGPAVPEPGTVALAGLGGLALLLRKKSKRG